MRHSVYRTPLRLVVESSTEKSTEGTKGGSVAEKGERTKTHNPMILTRRSRVNPRKNTGPNSPINDLLHDVHLKVGEIGNQSCVESTREFPDGAVICL